MMKMMATVAAASLVLLSTAGAAGAAPSDKAAMRKVAAAYYECNVASKPREAVSLVLDRTTARTIYKSLEQAMDPACRKGEVFKYLETLRGNVDLLRYGIATALVRHDYRTSFPQGIAAAPPLAHVPRPFDELAIRDSARFQRYGPKALEEEKQRKAIFDFLERFGDCVVRRNPAAAHRFLVTEVGSRDEVAAIAGVRPALATCLPADRKANLDLDMMRGAMADNFIRLAKAAPTTSAGQGGAR